MRTRRARPRRATRGPVEGGRPALLLGLTPLSEVTITNVSLSTPRASRPVTSSPIMLSRSTADDVRFRKPRSWCIASNAETPGQSLTHVGIVPVAVAFHDGVCGFTRSSNMCAVAMEGHGSIGSEHPAAPFWGCSGQHSGSVAGHETRHSQCGSSRVQEFVVHTPPAGRGEGEGDAV